jgi:hypothetical protein
MEQQRIEIASGGLQCDSPTCDWTDPTIQVDDYPKWLNAPCPKCGENVLTEEDLENTLLLRSIASLVNNIPEEHFEDFMKDLAEINSAKSDENFKEKYNLPEDTERISVTFDVHKGIHIKEVKPADDGKE